MAHYQVAEEMSLKVNLRIQGIPQDAVLEDQERMTKIQEVVESVVADSSEKGTFNKSSEE